MSHGIENKEERKDSGKDLLAKVTLSAKLEKDSVVLTVSDDGKGIHTKKIKEKIIKQNMVTEEVANNLSDNEIIRYIFEAGFSSAEKITDISWERSRYGCCKTIRRVYRWSGIGR